MSRSSGRSDQLLSTVRERLSTSLWALPGGMLLGAVLLALGTMAIDHATGQHYVFGWLAFNGSAEAAREILGVIAGSMLTITGVVFSITMLVLQLASSQFSPRALRTFLRDVSSKLALGTFLGTFAFALTGLTAVRSTENVDFVPGLTVALALLLVLTSLGMFLHFIHHTANKIRVSSIIQAIGEETAGLIEQVLPAEVSSPVDDVERLPGMSAEVRSIHTGAIVNVDIQGVIAFARERDGIARLIHPIGTFLPHDSVLLLFSDWLSTKESEQLAGLITFGNERTLQQDVAYGLQELSDIALRALSPAMNDPTTALNVIDAEHDLLLRIGSRGDEPSLHHDDEGRLRLVTTPVGWETYLRILFDELGEVNGRASRVDARLHDVAESLVTRLRHDRADAVRHVAGHWLGSSL